MEIITKLIESLFSGETPNSWLFMKFVTAFIGGLSVFIYKQYNTGAGETKINFWWKGFLFTLVSMFGGVFLIGPTTAFNAFASGLIGWSAIANFLKQENEGATNEQYTQQTLSPEQILQLLQNRK